MNRIRNELNYKHNFQGIKPQTYLSRMRYLHLITKDLNYLANLDNAK